MTLRELADWIEALAAKSTPGEWEPDNNDDRDCAQVILSSRFAFEIGDIFAGERPGECEANAALIVALVNAVPEITAALRRVEALEAENTRLLANVRSWVEWHRRCDADPDCTYLNDNAWCDAEAMASEGGVLLARAKLGKGPLDG